MKIIEVVKFQYAKCQYAIYKFGDLQIAKSYCEHNTKTIYRTLDIERYVQLLITDYKLLNIHQRLE